jgi:predicted nucleic acid-binding Zn ribbon protein
MVDYTCVACGAVNPVEPGFSRKKKKCPSCGAAISPEELQLLLEQMIAEQRQRHNRRVYLPLLLGFALLVATIIGCFARSFVVFYGAAFILILLSWVVYRKTVRLI